MTLPYDTFLSQSATIHDTLATTMDTIDAPDPTKASVAMAWGVAALSHHFDAPTLHELLDAILDDHTHDGS